MPLDSIIALEYGIIIVHVHAFFLTTFMLTAYPLEQLKNKKINNHSLPPKYIIFYHLSFVVRWSLTLIYI